MQKDAADAKKDSSNAMELLTKHKEPLERLKDNIDKVAKLEGQVPYSFISKAVQPQFYALSEFISAKL